MADILKFPLKKSIEDKFMKSLTEEQNEMFFEIIMKVREDYEQLQSKLVEKIAECELLKLKIKSLKE